MKLTFTYDDSQVVEWFANVRENQFQFVVETMQKVAYEVERLTAPKVPYEYGTLERSYKYAFIEKSSEFVEVEVGYHAYDPKANFAYAEYQHEPHTPPFNHPIKGQALFLWDTIYFNKNNFFTMIEKDYMSLFMGASR